LGSENLPDTYKSLFILIIPVNLNLQSKYIIASSSEKERKYFQKAGV